MAAFIASLTPVQLKLPANVQKSNTLKEHVNTARLNLSTDQNKFTLKRTGNARGDGSDTDEATKETRPR